MLLLGYARLIIFENVRACMFISPALLLGTLEYLCKCPWPHLFVCVPGAM